ncbi:hypothetical protein Poli38472_012225 [Pythium oligandrum]|uniref:Fanconi anemia group I protein n=1 Tax=Pythium oligandrum TaxID=41045 RepID=A0A8K1FNA3_PYTOL|nr:hypothetical protein Poli38472_012225 [Pythium oligandrum]|eukprot:TMW67109.1 hypothetical protein Poli38472_012225 [Pythium oligandrum]
MNAEWSMESAEATVAALVRLYETHKGEDKHAKAYALVVSVTEDDRLWTMLTERVTAESSVGRSAYTAATTSFLTVVQAVFWALRVPSDAKQGEELRYKAFMHVLQLLQTNNATTLAQSVVLVLMQELHNVRLTDVPAITAEVLRGIGLSKQWRRAEQADGFAVFYTIELFPHLLLRVASSSMIAVDEEQPTPFAEEQLSGADYRDRAFTKLCAMAWPRRFFLQLLKTLRDFPLQKNEERHLCIKIYREARKEFTGTSDPTRSLEILPTIFLSVLQLVGRTRNQLCGRLLISLLINKCEQLTLSEDRGAGSFLNPTTAELSERDLRAMQLTILYHLDISMKQYEQLGKTIVFEYEQRLSALSSFDVTVLLMVSSHSKYENSAMECLLRYIVVTYTADSSGNSDIVSQTSRRRAFSQVPQQATDGSWSTVVQQMVNLGFRLIEYHPPKGTVEGAAVTSGPSSSQSPPPWVDFGVRLVLGCFQYHEPVREKVLDRVVNMIVVQNAECWVYLQLLSRIVKRHLGEISGNLEARIRECLEYVTHMSTENASALLTALSPLLKMQNGLKNFVILTLRKAMFRKDESSRIIAIQGFSLLLCLSSRIFSRNRTLTQLYSQNVSMLSQGFGTTGGSLGDDGDLASQEHAQAMIAEDLYRQFSGIFRRALQLQTHVRFVLYAELIKVFLECPALRLSILELLFHHFMHYYETNESVQPPLKLDRSLSSATQSMYSEPLAYLLHTMFFCVRELKKEQEEESEDTMIDDLPATQSAGAQQIFDTVEQHLQILFERMKRCELSDFEFDKNASFSNDSELGETNRRLGVAVREVLHVCMNASAVFSEGVFVVDTSMRPEVWDSLVHYAQLHDWISRRLQDTTSAETTKKEGGESGSTGKKRKKAGAKKELQTNGKGSETTKKANSEESGSSFEQIASFRWASLLMPSTSLKILEHTATKIESGGDDDVDINAISTDEEHLLLLALERATHALTLAHRAQQRSSNFQESVPRSKSAVLSHPQESMRFSRRLGAITLRLFKQYSRDDISGAVISAAVKRGSEQSHTLERQRRILSAALCTLGPIVDWWASSCSTEEFVDNLMEMLGLEVSRSGNDDEDSEQAQEGGEPDNAKRVLSAFGAMIAGLVERQFYEETTRLLTVLRMVWSKLPLETVSEHHLPWMQQKLGKVQASPRLLEAMIHLLLHPHPASAFQAAFAEQLAHALRNYCNGGEDDALTAERATLKFESMTEKTVVTVATAVLSKIDGSLGELEIDIKAYVGSQRRHRMKLSEDDVNILQELEDETGVHLLDIEDQTARYARYKRLARRLFDVAGAVRPFVAMDLNKATLSMRVVRLIGRLYKLLVLMVNDRVRRKDTRLPKFLRQLFDRTAGELSPALLQFIACIHEESKRASAAGPSKRGRPKTSASTSNGAQSKLIPDVIYQLEQYDLTLIKLSKLCKGEDFSAWCKLRQSRDFRFNKERIKQSMANEDKPDAATDEDDTAEEGLSATVPDETEQIQDEEEEEEEGNEDTQSASDDEQHVAKRARGEDATDEDEEEEEEEL